MTDDVATASPESNHTERWTRRAVLAVEQAPWPSCSSLVLEAPLPVATAAGDPLILGAANSAGATNTTLRPASSGTALQVTQNGEGAAATRFRECPIRSPGSSPRTNGTGSARHRQEFELTEPTPERRPDASGAARPCAHRASRTTGSSPRRAARRPTACRPCTPETGRPSAPTASAGWRCRPWARPASLPRRPAIRPQASPGRAWLGTSVGVRGESVSGRQRPRAVREERGSVLVSGQRRRQGRRTTGQWGDHGVHGERQALAGRRGEGPCDLLTGGR